MAPVRLTILGSGWGAFRLLKDICPKTYSVTVVSPRNHVLFTPMLPSASVGTVSTRSITESLRPLCIEKGARLCEAHAEHLDLKKKTVQCRSLHGERYTVPYDRLVLAVGKKANDFGIPGVQRNAFFIKETADARRLREALLTRFEEAACIVARSSTCGLRPSDEQVAQVEQLLRVIVVGGGPISAGFSEHLVDFIGRDVRRTYPDLIPYMSVHLVEWASCTQIHRKDQALREYMLQRLSQRSGVQLHRGEHIEGVTQSELRLESGRSIPYGTLVWNAGMKPVPIVQSADLPKARNDSKVRTDECLRVPGVEGVFAIGDCAHVGESGLPQMAHIAQQQASYLAEQLNNGEEFSKQFEVQGVAPLAGASGVGARLVSTLAPPGLAGRLAWLWWRSAALRGPLSLRSRLALISELAEAKIFGRCFVREGQDTTALPTRPSGAAAAAQPPAVAEPASAPCEARKIEESLSTLLDDIGMRPSSHVMRMPEIGMGVAGVGAAQQQDRRGALRP